MVVPWVWFAPLSREEAEFQAGVGTCSALPGPELGDETGVSGPTCSRALLHCWSLLRGRGNPAIRILLRLPVLLILTLQELGPVGILPPAPGREVGGTGAGKRAAVRVHCSDL